MDISRLDYVEKLYGLKDNGLIKIVSGLRRSGKSNIFKEYKEYLISKGIKANQVAIINFETLGNEKVFNAKGFYNYVLQKTVDDKMYLLLDEIYLVDEYYNTIQTLLKKNHYDIYIATSNKILFNETFKENFDKKYVEVEAFPLSFKEYYNYKQGDKLERLNEYLHYGSLPHVCKNNDIDSNISYIEGMFNTIIVKDLVNILKINDIQMLISIVKFLFENVNRGLTSYKICQEITSSYKKITPSVLETYLKALIDSYVIHKVEGYNIKTKLAIKGYDKYYLTDLGFRIATLGEKRFDTLASIDNVVYLELLRRGYKLFIGKYEDDDVDFFATYKKDMFYFQVIDSTKNKALYDKKVKTLNLIHDNYPKSILSLEDESFEENGIKVVNIFEWLLEN